MHKIMYKIMLAIWVIMFLTALPCRAEDPNQWQYGYYGLEGDPNTVALWHLDDSWIDSTGNGYDFVYWYGGQYAPGKFDSNGVDLYGNFNSIMRRTTTPAEVWSVLLSSAGVTAEAWIYPDISPQRAWASIVDGITNNGFLLRYNIDGSKLWAIFNVVGVGGVIMEGVTDITPNEWHHVAMVRDKATGWNGIYLDGVLEVQTVAGTDANLYGSWPSPSNHVIAIGGNPVSGAGYEFDGKVDEIRISKVARFAPPSPECGDPGTVMAADLSGPVGAPDCYIDLYDFAVLAADWLRCTDPNNPACE